jgi:hypothetical protein
VSLPQERSTAEQVFYGSAVALGVLLAGSSGVEQRGGLSRRVSSLGRGGGWRAGRQLGGWARGFRRARGSGGAHPPSSLPLPDGDERGVY